MACRLYGAKPLSEPMLGISLMGTLGVSFSEIVNKINITTVYKVEKVSGGDIPRFYSVV